VPPLPIVPDDLPGRIAKSGAQVVFGPRSGSKTGSLQIPDMLPPGPLQALLPMRVWRVESMRPNVSEPVQWGSEQGQGRYWRDLIEADGDGLQTIACFGDGHPAIVRKELAHYLAGIFDAELTTRYFEEVARAAGLTPQRLPEGLRLQQRGGLQFAFNYSDAPIQLPQADTAQFLVGQARLEPQGVAIYRSSKSD
ncbi:beta-galactosidase trimerization domain-containing protein, partial [Herbaspirillum sp.]|uniref:beta-galactosidase trimerization domain-containing protein n=1 Tax=Herbaspirillum sp. TaxID=1890675 RepID=UPI0031D6EC99